MLYSFAIALISVFPLKNTNGSYLHTFDYNLYILSKSKDIQKDSTKNYHCKTGKNFNFRSVCFDTTIISAIDAYLILPQKIYSCEILKTIHDTTSHIVVSDTLKLSKLLHILSTSLHVKYRMDWLLGYYRDWKVKKIENTIKTNNHFKIRMLGKYEQTHSNGIMYYNRCYDMFISEDASLIITSSTPKLVFSINKQEDRTWLINFLNIPKL